MTKTSFIAPRSTPSTSSRYALAKSVRRLVPAARRSHVRAAPSRTRELVVVEHAHQSRDERIGVGARDRASRRRSSVTMSGIPPPSVPDDHAAAREGLEHDAARALPGTRAARAPARRRSAARPRRARARRDARPGRQVRDEPVDRPRDASRGRRSTRIALGKLAQRPAATPRRARRRSCTSRARRRTRSRWASGTGTSGGSRNAPRSLYVGKHAVAGCPRHLLDERRR